MNSTTSLTRRHALIATCAALSPALGRSQTALPDVLRMIMPFPPGNALDASARWFAEAYRNVTGRNAIVENKPGAAATIAAGEVSRSKPDGSVVLFTTAGHLTTAVLMKKIPYEPIDGFTPVTPVAVGELLLKNLPSARLGVVPGADHDLEVNYPELIASFIEAHLRQP